MTTFRQAERRRRRFLVSQTKKIEKALNEIGDKPTKAKFEKLLFDVWGEVGLSFARFEFNLLKSHTEDIQLKQFSNDDFLDTLKVFLGETAAERIVGMVDTTKGIIKRVLQQAIDEGLGSEEAARRLRDELKLRNKIRARVIARTEVTAASNYGSFQGALQTGLKFNKKWSAAIDDRTRDDHKDLHNDVVGMNKRFKFGLRFPGDPSGPAEQVVNCRCAVKYIPKT